LSGAFHEAGFEAIAQGLFAWLSAGEHLSLELKAEDSQFVRVNRARVRQAGRVEVGELTLLLVQAGDDGLRECAATVSVTGDLERDLWAARAALGRLRSEVGELPVSPWARLPTAGPSTRTVTRGDLLDPDAAAAAILAPAEGLDLAGILASGTVIRGSATSAGRLHWFEADTFSFDHSVYAAGGAAHKATYAGTAWDSAAWTEQLTTARGIVAVLDREPRVMAAGEHRVYLGPSAVGDLLTMLSWGCIGEGAVRQGDSALRHVRSGAQRFSPLLSLSEDFSAGDVPRFDAEGEVAPLALPLVADGVLVDTLVSARTAQEYGIATNGADASEALRAPSIRAGTLREQDVFTAIGTGLYIPNLWYLNWSDQPGGRVTGMTRYACLRVEDGRAVGPIQHLRFDDSIFRMLGSELEALGDRAHVLAETGSYEMRAVGAMRTPGILLRGMAFTL
jgi:predicted Zn-dependent protease